MPLEEPSIVSLICEQSLWCNASTLSSISGRPESIVADELERWMHSRLIISLSLDNTKMFPMYAFDKTIHPEPAMAMVIEALDGKSSDLKIAAWLASPNSWLANRLPCEVFHADLQAVLDAARIEMCGVTHG